MAFDDRHTEPHLAFALVGIGTAVGAPVLQRVFDLSVYASAQLALVICLILLGCLALFLAWYDRQTP